MKIALATPRVAGSFDEAMEIVERHITDAAKRGAKIVCFPEAYVPGLRGLDFEVYDYDRAIQVRAIEIVADLSRTHSIATILGLELPTDSGRRIAAAVIDTRGTLLGYQTKNQIDPTEEAHYICGHTRRIFEIDGLRFGIAICLEGFRYPETVRWAAVRGAKVVFHPHCTGSDQTGVKLTTWGDSASPYYERAMAMRSRENTIFFASVNYAFRNQESATSLIDPTGECQAFLPYGEEGVLVEEIDPSRATGFLAGRYAPERYVEEG